MRRMPSTAGRRRYIDAASVHGGLPRERRVARRPGRGDGLGHEIASPAAVVASADAGRRRGDVAQGARGPAVPRRAVIAISYVQ